jgi:hypothetical protein
MVAFIGTSYADARSSDTWLNNAEHFVDDGTNPNGTYRGPTCYGMNGNTGNPSNDNTGSLWVTDTNGVEGVRVVGDQNSVNVRIYSTVRGCGTSKGGDSKSSLAFVEPCTVQGSRGISFTPKVNRTNMYYTPPGGNGLPSGGSSRGDTQYYIDNRDRQANYNWSDNFQSTNYIDATIDITGLNSGNYVVCIRGTYSSDSCGSTPQAYCKSADREVGFTIDRSWSIDEANTRAEVQSISGTGSKTDAAIGSTVTWLHTVRNAGPSATNTNLTYLYNNATAANGGSKWSDVIVGFPSVGIGGSIKNARQNRCMDINGATTGSATTEVRQWNCNGSANQLWTYDTVTQTLKSNTSSTKCLNATSGAVGSVVNLVSCNGSTNQKWNFSATNVQIKNVASGLCLDSGGFNGAGADDNGNVEKLWTCLPSGDASAPNQSWFTGTQGHPHVVGSGMAAGASESFTSTYKIQASDVGKTLCRRTSVTPRSSTNAGWYDSVAACIGVPYRYTLKPVITSDKDVAEVGSTVHLSSNVSNVGPTASPVSTQWRTTQIIVRGAGTAVPQINNTSGRQSAAGTGPCAFYAARSVECTAAPLDSGTESIAVPRGAIAERDVIVGDLKTGDKLCFGNSVQPFSSTSNNWLHSELVCLIVSKKPSVNITGGDVIVGKGLNGVSDIVTSTTSKQITDSERRIFGSWGEYGVIADGSISGMASASGYAGGQIIGASPTANAFCSVSFLTITNAGTNTCSGATAKGNYPMKTGFPAIASEFTVNKGPLSGTDSAPLKVGDLDTGVYSATGTVFIDAGTIKKGRSVIIKAPTANIVIKGNITYDEQGGLNSLRDIPQLVLIANSIKINGGVTNVDSWLVATGSVGEIKTCNDITSKAELKSTVCSNPLTVNGPVVAKRLYLWRTAGAETGLETKNPAEVFNLRPDAYLWATSYKSANNPRLQTSSTIELPPRY